MNRPFRNEPTPRETTSRSGVSERTPPSLRPFTIILADDEPVVRSLLAKFILEDPLFDVVAQAGDAEEAILAARTHQPDIALVDVNMPGGGGARAAREIRAVSPLTRVVAMTAAADRETVLEMLSLGCVGYLVKTESLRSLTTLLRDITEGKSALSAGPASHVLDELTGQREVYERSHSVPGDR